MDVVITLTLVMTPVGFIIPVITSLKFGMNFRVTLFLVIKGEARAPLIKFANFREYDEIPTPNLNLLYCCPFSRLCHTIDRAAHGYIHLAA